MRLRTVAILRGFQAERTVEIAERCWAAGIDLVEVPVQDRDGWTALEQLAGRAHGRRFGVGTVLRPSDVRRGVALGACVLISPATDAAVIQASFDAGALPLPGVMTPTDVARATVLGVQTCKLFPADLVGRGWFGAMRGPFPAMGFIAVGGVDLRNAADFLRAGASGVGFGSSIESVLALDDPAGFVAELHSLVQERAPQPALASAGRDG